MTDYQAIREDYETEGFELDDLDPDALMQARTWFDAAVAADEPQPNAMSLATVGLDRRPSVRTVLLKGIDTGFVFYTNFKSRKGRELTTAGVAAASLTWLRTHRQIRIEGRVEKVSDALSDDYWASRPYGAQIAAAASEQSAVLADRSQLLDEIGRLEGLYPDAVPRPDVWGGYRIVPDAVEFWQGRRNRTHDRALYRRTASGGWTRKRLAP